MSMNPVVEQGTQVEQAVLDGTPGVEEALGKEGFRIVEETCPKLFLFSFFPFLFFLCLALLFLLFLISSSVTP